MKSVENIVGYYISTLDKKACIQKIFRLTESGRKGSYFVCANPHSVETARSDILFDASIRNADLVIPDGAGMVIASRILKGNIRHRVTGTDIFMGLCQILNQSQGFSMFFLGSSDEILEKIREKMGRDFPNIRVAGTLSPPYKPDFSDEDNQQMINAINQVQPDVLWVGMTAPKQEKWIYQHKDRLNVKFMGPIGAVFDFYTGNVRRSHPIFQKIGLEWLPRLLKQPMHLYQRTLLSAPKFLIRVIGQKFKMTEY